MTKWLSQIVYNRANFTVKWNIHIYFTSLCSDVIYISRFCVHDTLNQYILCILYWCFVCRVPIDCIPASQRRHHVSIDCSLDLTVFHTEMVMKPSQKRQRACIWGIVGVLIMSVEIWCLVWTVVIFTLEWSITGISVTVEEPKFICKQAYTWDEVVCTLPQVENDDGQRALLVFNCGCITFLC